VNELDAFGRKNPRKDLTETDADAIRAKLDSAEIREILGILHRALGRPKCSFGLDYSKGAVLSMPHLMMMQSAARLLALEAWSRAAQRDGAGALDSVRDGFRIGGTCLGDGLLISYLVAMACDGLTLNWAGATLAKVDPASISLAGMDALSGDLSVRRAELRPAFLHTVDAERIAMGSWGFEGLLSGGLDPSLVLAVANNAGGSGLGMLKAMAARCYVWLGRPILKEDYRIYLELMMEFRRLAAQPCDAAGAEAARRFIEGVPRYAVLTRQTAPAFQMCLPKAGEYEALLDVACAGLAVERHRAKTGAYPGRLADATGGSAPAMDPFSNRELAYKPAEKGCLVYSVGSDGRDNGGRRKGGGAKEYDIVWEVAR
jgi:hypothetical protein